MQTGKSGFVFILLALIVLAVPPARLLAETADDIVEIKLAGDALESAKAPEPQTSLPDTIRQIQIQAKDKTGKGIRLDLKVSVDNVAGFHIGQKIYSQRLQLKENANEIFTLSAKQLTWNHFYIGTYKAELLIDYAGKMYKKEFLFSVKPVHDQATTITPTALRGRFNIANRALGGQLVSFSSERDNTKWSAQSLNDGSPYTISWIINRECSVCGWASKSAAPFPQDLVFSFYQNQTATVNAVMVDTSYWTDKHSLKGVPRYVEIWAAETDDQTRFKKIKTARLQNTAAERLIHFSAIPVRLLKVRVLDTHSENWARISEIKIIEADSEKNTILKTYPINLADPQHGGYLVRYTSDSRDNPVAELFDGKTSTSGGWAAARTELGEANYLPQAFTFGFKNQRQVLIDEIQINPESGPRYFTDPNKSKYWAKTITVYGSNDSPVHGFQLLSTIQLAAKPGLQSFKLGKIVRYLQLKITENHGGESTSMGELRIIEGRAPAYQSAALEGLTAESASEKNTLGKTITKSSGETPENKNAIKENEPNNSAETANQFTFSNAYKGVISPLSDTDFYKFTLFDTGSKTLNIRLQGYPFLATTLSVLDKDKQLIAAMDPGQSNKLSAELSHRLAAGDYYLKLHSDPASIVLIWDTSGSMEGQTKSLENAVHDFIQKINPSMQVNLIRFSGHSAEVLLKDFSNDKQTLLAASKGKFDADGGTPLYDAIRTGLDLLASRKGNKAIVVLSDGADTESKLTHSAFWRVLDKNKVPIYIIGLGFDLSRYLAVYASNGTNILKTIAETSGGKSYFTTDPEKLKVLYKIIADELNTQPNYVIQANLSTGKGKLQLRTTGERIAAVATPAHMELILDASGSMRRKIGNKSMIDIARTVLSDVVKQIPSDVQVAFRVYGNRIQERRKGDCQDTTLVVPFSKLDKPLLARRIQSIRALGTTPIAYTLRQLKQDFSGIQGKKLVILVTDGKEECGGDPTKEIAALKSAGVDFNMNIVGFALDDKGLQESMQQLARSAGGSYYHAKNSQELKQALADSMSVSYSVHDSSGKQIAQGYLDKDPVELDEGLYTLRIKSSTREIVQEQVRIKPNTLTTIEIHKEGSEINARTGQILSTP